MEYEEEDFLQLSGIQHFLFCRRQWALIHIENQWAENGRTMDGIFFHQHAHDSTQHEKRGNILISRGMYIHSRELGLSGQCDIVEFYRSEQDGVSIHGQTGLWKPYPIEYKRGRQKPDIYDEAQVCAQAMCLEEMYVCTIENGALFYGEDKRRHVVTLDSELRQKVRNAAREMHAIYQKGVTPRAHKRKACMSCSLVNLCLPELEEAASVSSYLARMLRE